MLPHVAWLQVFFFFSRFPGPKEEVERLWAQSVEAFWVSNAALCSPQALVEFSVWGVGIELGSFQVRRLIASLC